MLKELKTLGLKEKHARIYGAALQLGASTVATLSQKSGLKRPTVYLQLEEMIKEGFMEKSRINKKTVFRPRDPSLFEKHELERQSVIERLKNEYQQSRASSGMPQVSVYEGLESVKQLYREIGDAHFIRFWSSLSDLHPFLWKEYELLSEKIRGNAINVREMIVDTKEARRNSRYLSKICGPTYSSRVAPLEAEQNDSAVTNRALYIFRLHELNFFAVKIEDPAIAATYRSLFDMAWKDAKPL